MSLHQLLKQPLSVQTMGAPSLDSYGDEVRGALGDPFVVLGYIEQRTSAEYLADRDTDVSGWVAYLRGHRMSGSVSVPTMIGPLDTITYGGQLFQVNGVPEHVWSPRIQRVSHLVCKLVAISG